MLYFRMILIMGVTLYTTRIILIELGVKDFGVYNVVGGIVTMLGFLSNSMSSSVQRFLSYELGKSDVDQLRKVFAMSVNIQALIAVSIVIFAESLGLWFVNTQLSISSDRVVAANWVYQFSILTFVINVISVPYNASILAYEKMSAFAYISLLEVTLKLIAVYTLSWMKFDKLVLYAVLVLIISLIIRIIYGLYVRIHIKDCKYHFIWDKNLFMTLASFAGWNLWGNIAAVAYNQGLNILLNIFFGPVINTARAIAFQVNAALNSFIQNIQVAIKPQIIKSFATEDLEYMHILIFRGAKYSFFLMLLISIPVMLSTPQILKVWLVEVPEYTVVFCRLILIESLINSLSGTLMAGAQASGKIKLYQGVVGGLLLLNLPISFIFLYFGYSPEITFIIGVTIAVVALIARVFIMSSLLEFSKKIFFTEVLLPVIFITMIVAAGGILLSDFSEGGFKNLLIANLALICLIGGLIYLIGLGLSEKAFFKTKFLHFKKALIR